MCYTSLTIKQNNDTEHANEIIEAIENKMATNTHGYAFLNDAKKECRTVDKNTFLKAYSKEWVNGFNWNIVHFRQATTGAINKKNVHLWNRNNWRFCHNGFVFGYGNVTTADSLDYFQRLLKEIKKNDDKDIIRAINKMHDEFTGRAFLVSPTNEIYIYGSWDVYSFGSYVVISSAPLSLNGFKRFGDLSFVKKSDEVLKTDIDADDIYKYSADGLKRIGTLKEAIPKYNYASYHGKTYPKQIGFNPDVI